jgi:hypothetical protein
MRSREPPPYDYEPLDLWCPVCDVAPGIRCVWTPAGGTPRSRHPHAARVTASRQASAAGQPPENRRRSRS